jgi:hypothetical protein
MSHELAHSVLEVTLAPISQQCDRDVGQRAVLRGVHPESDVGNTSESMKLKPGWFEGLLTMNVETGLR